MELADVQFGDTVLVIGIGPVGDVGGRANMRGASRIIAVGTRPNCMEAARGYGASDFISYKDGTIEDQVLALTDGKGVDKVVVAGGGCETFESAVKCLKPGGKIGNVNYLGSGTYVNIPRVEWGVGMGHKQINGGLMPAGVCVWRSWARWFPQASWMCIHWFPMYLKAGIMWKRRCS